MTLVVDAPLTIGSISLSEGSQLTVVTNNSTMTVSGDAGITGAAASLVISGTGTVEARKISVQNLDVQNATLMGVDSSAMFTASDSISASSATVRGASTG